MTYSPPNGIMSSLTFHFTQFYGLQDVWELLNDRTIVINEEISIKRIFSSSFQHVTLITLPFSQIKVNSENFKSFPLKCHVYYKIPISIQSQFAHFMK